MVTVTDKEEEVNSESVEVKETPLIPTKHPWCAAMNPLYAQRVSWGRRRTRDLTNGPQKRFWNAQNY